MNQQQQQRKVLACESKKRGLNSYLDTDQSDTTISNRYRPPPHLANDHEPIAKRRKQDKSIILEHNKHDEDLERVICSNQIIPQPLDTDHNLPNPKTMTGIDPDTFLLQLVQVQWGINLKINKALELEDYFCSISEEQMAAYNVDIVSATRENNVSKLREYLENRGRGALDCFNRFGEGLLNLACRRGFKDIVQFLLSPEVALNVRVRDDYGRTPLHDACWNPEPQVEICSWVLQKDPSLFLVADKRGYTPFQYARKSDWHIWRQFLYDHRRWLVGLTQPEILNKFGK